MKKLVVLALGILVASANTSFAQGQQSAEVILNSAVNSAAFANQAAVRKALETAMGTTISNLSASNSNVALSTLANKLSGKTAESKALIASLAAKGVNVSEFKTALAAHMSTKNAVGASDNTGFRNAGIKINTAKPVLTGELAQVVEGARTLSASDVAYVNKVAANLQAGIAKTPELASAASQFLADGIAEAQETGEPVAMWIGEASCVAKGKLDKVDAFNNEVAFNKAAFEAGSKGTDKSVRQAAWDKASIEAIEVSNRTALCGGNTGCDLNGEAICM